MLTEREARRTLTARRVRRVQQTEAVRGRAREWSVDLVEHAIAGGYEGREEAQQQQGEG